MYPFSPWICVFSELFQNSLILWVYLHVSLQYCWEPAWGVPPIAKVMRLRGLTGKGESGLREPHWICSCICPKNQSLPALLHYAFHLYFWHYGGLSPTTSLCKGVNLGLQLRNLLGVVQKLFWWLSSLPDKIIQPHVLVYSLPTVKGMRCFKLSKNRFFWEVRKLLV